jgi:ubiquinone/menaquinone biosynthesis C-methylase UbiE
MERYFTELANAFVRGRLKENSATLQDGLRAGLRLHKFKSNTELPRVSRVLGILRGLQPANLLDVGSGRGTVLWPLLNDFPGLAVTTIDVSERRCTDLAAVRAGGVNRLTVARMDAQRMAFSDRAFDVVTMLESLEHMPNPRAALSCVMRVARRFVVVSVPSTPDDNPEHLHLFAPDDLHKMARELGAARTTIEHVLNHRIVVIRLDS